MATTRDEQAPLSWEQILLAINPQQGLHKARLRGLVNAIQKAHQEGQPLDPEVEGYAKALMASIIYEQVNAMIGDLMVPRDRNQARIRRRGRSVRNRAVHGGRQPVRLF